MSRQASVITGQDMASPAPAAAVVIEDLQFAWKPGAPVLDVAEFTVAAGERVFLQGASGSGKSTLLGLICGVLSAQAGSLNVLGEDLTRLKGAARDRLRATRIGVIFQMFNLLPFMAVTANVALPCRFSRPRRERAIAAGGLVEDEARRLLSRLGLDDKIAADTPVSELSAGQQQRVAAARALIGGPDLIVADEPTSALDAAARDAFLTLLLEECAAAGAALIFVSHDPGLAPAFDRSVDLAAINRVARGAAP